MRDIKVKFKLKSLPKMSLSENGDNFSKQRNQGKPDKSPKRPMRGLKIAMIFTSLLVIIVLGIFSGKKTQNTYTELIDSKNQIKNISKIASGDEDINAKISGISQKLEIAQNDLSNAQKNINKISFLKSMPILGEAVSSGNNLIESGYLTLRSANNLSDQGSNIFAYFLKTNIDLNNFSESDVKDLINNFGQIKPTLVSSLMDVEKAQKNIDQIPSYMKIGQVGKTTNDLSNNLNSLNYFLSAGSDFVDFVPSSLGMLGNKTYLLLFQNSEELMPGGGFLGSYGIVTLENGRIKNLFTDNIYNLDNKFQEKIEPPKAIKEIYPKYYWNMHQANWWADFPTSAKKAQDLFTRESQGSNLPEISGVIAIDPKVLVYLLEVMGPTKVTTPEYSYIFTSSNVINILERYTKKTAVEIYRNEGDEAIQEHRKDIISDLTHVLMNKLPDLPKDKWPQLASYIKKGVDEKHIMIYSNEQGLQNILAKYNFDAHYKETNFDYLSVVDANLSGNKSNRALEQNIEYNLDLSKDVPKAELSVKYFLNSPRDWKTKDYFSYTRVYVPIGSKLISSEGLDRSETFEELGKTVFAGWIKVPLQEHRQFNLVYELPKEATNNKKYKYDLIFQKQPGTDVVPVNVNIKLPQFQKISEIYPDTKTNFFQTIKWASNLNIDREFYIK